MAEDAACHRDGRSTFGVSKKLDRRLAGEGGTGILWYLYSREPHSTIRIYGPHRCDMAPKRTIGRERSDPSQVSPELVHRLPPVSASHHRSTLPARTRRYLLHIACPLLLFNGIPRCLYETPSSSGILSVIVGSMAAAPSPYSEIYIFPAMVQWFFYLLALCMTFYILFRLAQLFQQRSMGGSSRKLGRMHMFSLAVVVLASLLEWIFYVVYICQGQRIFSHRIFYDTYHWSGCVRQLVHWLASLQVLIQAIFATVRSYKMDRQVSVCSAMVLERFAMFRLRYAD